MNSKLRKPIVKTKWFIAEESCYILIGFDYLFSDINSSRSSSFHKKCMITLMPGLLLKTACSSIYFIYRQIFTVSESWQHWDISGDVITIYVPNHSLFRSSRTDRCACGTVVLCDNIVHSNLVYTIRVIGIEFLWCKIIDGNEPLSNTV